MYDIDGRRVATLWKGVREAGVHSFPWAGRDDDGREVASGVYFARMVTPVGTATVKLTLIR